MRLVFESHFGLKTCSEVVVVVALEVLEVFDVDGPGRDLEGGFVLRVLLELTGVARGADPRYQRRWQLLGGWSKRGGQMKIKACRKRFVQ